MDLLILILEKTEYFSVSENDRGISSIVSHIQTAEKHFANAKAGDEYLFNDVIYRCNQAFEGALKEAYLIISGKDSSKVTPYQIEEYFEKEEILKERVLQLFTNYRTEWRNKSTHDYKLFFSEQEAFLAIISISAFINILLDQMIEKKAYDKEKANLEFNKFLNVDIKSDYTLANKIIHLLKLFSNEISEKTIETPLHLIREAEIVGMLTAFINNFAPDIKVYTGYPILKGKKLFIDLLLESNKEKLIIEIKRTGMNPNSGTEQLFHYLIEAGLENGILYIPPKNSKEEIVIVPQKRIIDNRTLNVIQVFSLPKS